MSDTPSKTAPSLAEENPLLRPWQTPLGISVLVAGAAGLAAGGTFGGLALVRRDERERGDRRSDDLVSHGAHGCG